MVMLDVLKTKKKHYSEKEKMAPPEHISHTYTQLKNKAVGLPHDKER